MQQPYILGIDIGTGSTKAVAVNYACTPIFTAQAYYPTNHPKPGYSEQDPELIWQGFLQCINEVCTKLSISPAAISFSSAMHSVIAVNGEGHPLTPLITWADARSTSIAEGIRNSKDGEIIYRATGTPVFAMSPLARIIWIREKQPELFQQTSKFISIKEFIWYRIFKEFSVDHSIASGTGLFNITSLEWNRQSLELAGISADHLSRPVNTGYTRYDFNPAGSTLTALKAGTPFVIGGSDGCLANLGSLAIESGTAAITIGTSGAVRISSPQPVYNFPAMTFNYILDEATYICGGPVNNGGIAIQWLIKNFLGKKEIRSEDYAELFLKMQSVPAGSEGLIFLPYLTGERAPVWDTKATGVFFGIRLHHTEAHFARAVLEGVCFGLRQVLEAVETGSENIRRIHVSGGFVTSELWIRMLTDITGRQVVLVQAEDASATGAAMIAMKSLSIVADYSSFLKERKLATIDPEAEQHKKYQAGFLVYKQLYQALKDHMHLLHQDNY